MTSRRSLSVLGSLFFLLPVIATVRTPHQSWTIAAMASAIIVATAIRPLWGLMLVTAAFVLAHPIQVLTGASSVVEQTLSPFLLAAGVRIALTARSRPSVLGRPAVVLGLVCAGSMLVQLSALQQTSMFAPAFLDGLWRHMSSTYFVPSSTPFAMVNDYMPWIEALMLAVLAEQILRREPGSGAAVARVLLLAGAGVAAQSSVRLIEVALSSGEFWANLPHFFRTLRFDPYTADLNAASSFYVLLCVPVLWLAVQARQWWARIASLPLLLALWNSGSRTAVAAAFAGAGVVVMFGRRPKRRTLLLMSGVAAVLTVIVFVTSTRHMTFSMAADIRVELVRAGLKLWTLNPIFGLGLGHFKPSVTGFLSADLTSTYPVIANGENAHNNYLQILVEFGAAGLAAFLWLLAAPAGRVLRAARMPGVAPELLGLSGGLAAFLLTCVVGHPLLNPQFLAALTLSLAIVTALATAALREDIAPRPARRWPARLSTIVLAAAVISVPARVVAERRTATLRNVVIGASDIQDAIDDIRYRIASAESAWYVPPTAALVDVPLRLTPDSRVCAVDISIDGRAADRATPTTETWMHVMLSLQVEPGATRPRRIDVHAGGDGCSLMVGAFVFR